MATKFKVKKRPNMMQAALAGFLSGTGQGFASGMQEAVKRKKEEEGTRNRMSQYYRQTAKYYLDQEDRGMYEKIWSLAGSTQSGITPLDEGWNLFTETVDPHFSAQIAKETDFTYISPMEVEPVKTEAELSSEEAERGRKAFRARQVRIDPTVPVKTEAELSSEEAERGRKAFRVRQAAEKDPRRLAPRKIRHKDSKAELWIQFYAETGKVAIIGGERAGQELTPLELGDYEGLGGESLMDWLFGSQEVGSNLNVGGYTVKKIDPTQ